ncbi:hypothetical protein NC653_019269 [Populus alba x Populus x berolinensis]|uniref:Uncharacterized protein n=1 Tax=Populus alba x Populus x berolinensis TaxID=444605 RepID=A0AAD6QIF1_9ROSI|nr:hypothetical protein NC653_019269 [Populus alba x Populus x berolinensis]
MPPVVMILDSLVNFYALSSTNVLHLPEQVEGPFLRSSVDKESCGWKHTAAISGNICFSLKFKCKSIVSDKDFGLSHHNVPFC